MNGARSPGYFQTLGLGFRLTLLAFWTFFSSVSLVGSSPWIAPHSLNHRIEQIALGFALSAIPAWILASWFSRNTTAHTNDAFERKRIIRRGVVAVIAALVLGPLGGAALLFQSGHLRYAAGSLQFESAPSNDSRIRDVHY